MKQDFNLPSNDIIFSSNLTLKTIEKNCDSEKVKNTKTFFRALNI